jgi:hypothetical protein
MPKIHLCTLEWHPACFEVPEVHFIDAPESSLDQQTALALTREIIEKERFFNGWPDFIESPWFSAEDFGGLISDMRAEHAEKVKKATSSPTAQPWLDALKSNGLNPVLLDPDAQQWLAKCPLSKSHHFMMVSLNSLTWGCGYCKKKGNLKELALTAES